MTGAHLDGNNAHLAPHIAETSLTCIEAHTPPPDCDLGVAEAREAWPGKGIHLNFPSSVHLSGAQAVLARAREMLSEMGDGAGFCMGLTEDIPTNDYLPAIAGVVRDGGKTRLTGSTHE